MFKYHVYGLTLISELLLPELLPGEGSADVCITLAEVNPIPPREHSGVQCASISPSHVHLTWGTVGDLWIVEGCRIMVVPAVGVDQEALRLFVLGPGLGVLLHQRGLLVFHASGVAIRDQVVGFIGAKGWGKSTTAAVLHQRGHALASDELLVVRFDEQSQPRVIPGASQIKLWVDALVSTGGNPDSTIRVRPGVDKFNVNAASIAEKELPFHGLYLLDVGEELAIQSVSPNEAFFGIVPHLYVYRFGTAFLQATGINRAFQQLSRLLKTVVVKRLLRQRDLNQLPDIAQRVEQDVLQEFELAKS